jgi:hypothetical protein
MKETCKINNRLKYRKWYERSAKRKQVSFFAYTPREKSHFRLAKRETRNENPFRIHSNVDLANLALLNLDLSGIQKKTSDSAEAPIAISSLQ